MKNKVLFGKEMFDALKVGIDIVYKAVSSTMGAAGRNAVYRSDYSGRPVSTNDGITIARRVTLEDEAAAMGAELITQSAERTNEEAGDGTTTAIVLTHAMIEKGLEMVKDKKFLGFTYKKGKNPMVLRKEMQESVNDIVLILKEIGTPIETDQELFNIANISMENPEVAKIIADSVKKVGEDGVVLVEESLGLGIERKDIEGLKFDKGYITPYMVSDPNTMEGILNDVHVLVTDKTFQLNKDLFPLLEQINKNNIKKLFIVCSGMNGEMLASIIRNRIEGKFYCVVVERPHDENVLEDIAILTGATSITNSNHPGDIVPMDFGLLGKAEKIIVDKDSTLIIGGAGDKEKIKERVNSIKKEIKETESPYKKDRLKERLAKLTGGIVILKVGAPTEADMKYMKLKVDDAVAATKAALQEGIVVGGGKTLFDISSIEINSVGDAVVKYACSMPMLTIRKNAGFEGDLTKTYNALTNKLTDTPIEDGIIDPVKVERCALQNAVSLAGIFLTSQSVIIDIPEKKSQDMV